MNAGNRKQEGINLNEMKSGQSPCKLDHGMIPPGSPNLQQYSIMTRTNLKIYGDGVRPMISYWHGQRDGSML